MSESASTKAYARLVHIQNHISHGDDDELIVHAVSNLLSSRGSASGSLRSLESHARARAMNAWFSEGDLTPCKMWFWTRAQLQQKRLRLEGVSTSSSLASLLSLLDPACSDDLACLKEAVILRLSRGHTDDVPGLVLGAIRSILIGEVSGGKNELVEDLRRVNDRSPYRPDAMFASALLVGTTSEIATAIRDVCHISAGAERIDDESGYTQDLISTPATLYAKVAWLLGHEMTIHHPLVPMEWMPVARVRNELGLPELSAFLDSR